MSSAEREIIFLILQLLNGQEKYKETVHTLEKESRFFFNMSHFEDIAINGDLEEVENYLSGFAKFDDNEDSMNMFYLIRKNKYIEALNRGDLVKAVEMLSNVKECSRYNEEDFMKIMMLLAEKKRDHGQPSRNAREPMLNELKRLIRANPLFHDKLNFSSPMNSRPQMLFNQSLRWQQRPCGSLRCGSPTVVSTPPPVNIPLAGSAPRVGAFPSARAQGPTPAPLLVYPGGLPYNAPFVPHQTSAAGPIAPTVPSRFSNSVSYPGQSHVHRLNASNDLLLPMAVVVYPASSVKSMDFHPVQRNLLLGTNSGDFSIWELETMQRLVSREFKVWNPSGCSMTLQASLEKENAVSVNRVIWSPDGDLFGVAYSKHIVHTYSYRGGENLQNYGEIDAHVGNVKDLAFSRSNKEMCLITCGEDNMIKVWSTATGTKLYTLEGHETSVYSVCQHHKFIFSMAIDGKIKAWLFDGTRMDGWRMVSSNFILIPRGPVRMAKALIRVHFHEDQNQIHVLAIYATQIAIYNAPSLEWLTQWSAPVSNGAITDCMYSCDGQSIYVAFEDGNVNILNAMTLQLKGWINPNAHLPYNPSPRIYPVVVAAHPTDPNQFALGFSDGLVRVLRTSGS